MSDKSAIEWTEATWNPVTGCTKVSPGCAYCYAERITTRFGGKPFLPGQAEIILHEERLKQPIMWRRPRMVFVNSMSDLFHEEVPDSFILEVWLVMAMTPEHTYQVLTKRPERMKEFVIGLQALPGGHQLFAAEMWPLPNVWLGVSVENQRWADERIPQLLETPAAVRFLSCEPLLGPIDLQRACEGTRNFLDGIDFESIEPWPEAPPKIDWVIVGGESGGPANRALVERCVQPWHDKRGGMICDRCRDTGWRPKAWIPNALEWVISLREQCTATAVPFFFKQWGGPGPTSGGRLLDGREWNEMPRVDHRRGGRMMADARV
jgi:protein gp37